MLPPQTAVDSGPGAAGGAGRASRAPGERGDAEYGNERLRPGGQASGGWVGGGGRRWGEGGGVQGLRKMPPPPPPAFVIFGGLEFLFAALQRINRGTWMLTGL